MKRFIRFFAFVFLSAVQNANAEEPKNGALEPTAALTEAMPVAPVLGLYRHLRSLQLVQDRMAEGNSRAMDAQRVVVTQLLDDLESSKGLEDLSESQAVINLSMALLNGADPSRIRMVLGINGIGNKDPFLLGALAYAEGRLAESLTAFEQVDAPKLPRIAFAQFQLTRGVLYTAIKPELAIKAFALARLSAPGTLIEESALRREAMLHIASPKRFLALLKSYLHRFENSPFASAFISQFAFSISGLDPAAQAEITSELDSVFASVKKQDKQNFFSILARSSLIEGEGALTEFATRQALREVTNPSMLLSARLYHAAFHVAGIDYKSAAAELHGLMRAPLQPADKEILKAAIGIAMELRRWPYDDGNLAGDFVVSKLNAQTAAAGDKSIKMNAAQQLLENTKTYVSE